MATALFIVVGGAYYVITFNGCGIMSTLGVAGGLLTANALPGNGVSSETMEMHDTPGRDSERLLLGSSQSSEEKPEGSETDYGSTTSPADEEPWGGSAVVEAHPKMAKLSMPKGAKLDITKVDAMQKADAKKKAEAEEKANAKILPKEAKPQKSLALGAGQTAHRQTPAAHQTEQVPDVEQRGKVGKPPGKKMGGNSKFVLCPGC